ncbi:lysozyme inhibitor LprI family protein [Aureimonas sp. AU20]|uniref:lysozyme inhibitor LprI family protein n=1 Tax=Aureimonas sp. AU20 TaxID=1349819 RepID=UPI0007209F61|nr:lysozyme inhibitor LprI family protein [Aureimonas sp. AU20]ALN71512.1 hypothetical protein M673_02230 [Aureimonas sp. AU20]
MPPFASLGPASILLLTLGLTLTAAPARALDCEAAQDQASLNFCAGRAYSEVDHKLNDLYRTLKDRLAGDHDRLARLVSAQRAWIAFRDAECDFVASATEGGSVQSMVHADCLRTETEQRIEHLESYANCEEGDLSCPVPAAASQAN